MSEYSSVYSNVRTGSCPSQLRITDIKYCKVDLPPWGCNLIKIETNQGICGFGEMRDGASPTYLKILKSRLIGENPCNVEKIFKKIKQFGGPARQAAGVTAVELALWDLTGKAYDVPVYQLLGGRFRDKVRLYADTHIETGRATNELMDPTEVGKVLKGHMDKGFTVLKILSVELLMSQEGNHCGPLDFLREVKEAEAEVKAVAKTGTQAEIAAANAKLYDFNHIPHPFTNTHITEQGLDALEEYIAKVRDVVGYKVPLAIDHFGHFPVNDMIKVARRLEKFNLAWLEDLIPWYLTDQYKRIKENTTASIATGEDIFLAENFAPLLENGSLDLVHPDLLTSGGMMETKKLSVLAEKHGASMAIHMCESPIAFIAATHLATACDNFFALEFDAFDSGWYADLVIGPKKPLAVDGFAYAEDLPGFGIEALNEDVIREHGPVKDKNIWMSTDDFNDEQSLDRIWS